MTTEKWQKTWTQAVCTDCWITKFSDAQRDADGFLVSYTLPGRVRSDQPDDLLENCSYCGRLTTSGIFRRDDPAEVPYPRYERADEESDRGETE